MTHVVDVDTPAGPARLHLEDPTDRPRRAARGVLALGHGAGGGLAAADLLAAGVAARAAGWCVAGVEQPWRVAGRRVAPAPRTLDAAWLPALAALITQLTQVLHVPAGVPLVVGGRSAGARVACRTAAATGAAGVVCLAFPLHPPGRPERSRLDELAGAAALLPVLVVQGERDAFGRAPEVAAVVPDGVRVVAVPGDHGLAAGAAAAGEAVAAWLAERFA